MTVSVTVSGVATGHNAAPLRAGWIGDTGSEVARGTLIGPTEIDVAMLKLESDSLATPVNVILGKNGKPVPVPVGNAPKVPLPVRIPEGTIPVALARVKVGKLEMASY